MQIDLLTEQEWSADLCIERLGEWRWTVTMIDSGQAAATSAEWMFWF